MMILADGQVQCAIRADVKPGTRQRVKEDVKGFRDEVRNETLSLSGLLDRLRAHPDVVEVQMTGARSSMPIALRTAVALSRRPARFYSQSGVGEASDFIRKDLESWKAGYVPLKTVDGDMPMSVMLFDPAQRGSHESVGFYPLSRTQYKHLSVYPENDVESAEALMMNRTNQRLGAVAKKLYSAERLVSLRIHGYSRHVGFLDYVDLFPYLHQVVMDQRDQLIRQTATALGLSPERGWTGRMDAVLVETARRLDEKAGHPLLQFYYLNDRFELAIFFGTFRPAVFSLRPPVGSGRPPDLKMTSRIHGAAVAGSLGGCPQPAFSNGYFPGCQDELDLCAQWVFKAAATGLLDVPWQWPSAGFTVDDFDSDGWRRLSLGGAV